MRTGDQAVVDALADLGRRATCKLERRLKKAVSRGAEGVHDARSALRRLRVLVDIARRTTKAKRTRRARAELRWFERSLGGLRDVDVAQALVVQFLRECPHAVHGLGALQALLERRHRREERAARPGCAKASRRRLVRRLRALFTPRSRSRSEGNREPWGGAVCEFAREAIRHGFERAGTKAVHAAGDFAQLHRYRVACRELAMVLAMFRAAFPDSRHVAEELRAIQTQLGEMHDRHLSLSLIARAQARGELEESRGLETYVAWLRSGRDQALSAYTDGWLSVVGERLRVGLADMLDVEPQLRA